MIPTPVLALIEETPSAELPGRPTVRDECQGAKFHSPRPMIVHPFEMPRADGKNETVYLCGTCADNVKVLFSLLKARQGDVPWTVKRSFGNLVRGVAEMAYAHSTEEQDHA